ncbi:glucan biosynthesis protein G [Martelella lutilitoris]|uniref:Glucans biosynthesis protein G n=1 Tax=Martelella lutilitoris TaxID=2583532 RepID=A0A7T7HJG6_9HYPH|nr:glucan biosynthesis protein G [Martelella lutilitoris]QQM30323.1 glucan biosynthesis protein G [Martelella lutilitoris]
MKRRFFLAQTAVGALAFSGFAGRAIGQDAAVEPAKVPDQNDAVQAEAPSPDAFTFDTLTARMKARAAKPYQEPAQNVPAPFESLHYDDYRAVRYDPNKAIWRDQSDFQLQAFSLGWLFKTPVEIYEVANGKAEKLVFSASDFIFRAPLDAEQFKDVELPGVAGFRINYPLNRSDVSDELISFLGSSYFRALGQGNLYGLSARGLAINTATNEGEEFPRFSAFYIVRPAAEGEKIIVFAELDGPSVAGAYRFVITPGKNTRMDVTARLFFRNDIARLGVAPMTSMFLFGPANHHAFDDYRERVHDSEGLKIVRADGTELWRNLQNAKKLANSFFAETDPRAFGLYQRHRDFEDYQDAEAHYERRPSLLVEPLGNWGKGSISLVEIPTDKEVNDNIVAFWQPEAPAKAGGSAEYSYRLTWGAIEEDRARIARVVDIRSGEGGVSGTEADEDVRKLVVDFAGGALDDLGGGSELQERLHITNGEIVHSTVSAIRGEGVWRLAIDVRPAGEAPVELVGALSDGSRDLSEIWLYQWRRGDDQPD